MANSVGAGAAGRGGKRRAQHPLNRSQIMARVRSRDARPDLGVREALWDRGLRYRACLRIEGVSVDVAFPSHRLAVFVDGCFWHKCPLHYAPPKSRARYWTTKLERNAKRAAEQEERLRSAGWTVLRVWEHECEENVAAVVSRVAHALDELRPPSLPAHPGDAADLVAGGEQPVALDLFCGAGGLSLGFEQAGFDVRAAFDVEERHVATYRANFPHAQAFQTDLSSASAGELRAAAQVGDREIDVLFGGPPCQGFSVGGIRLHDDSRNGLLVHFARLVGEICPRYFVVENVEGLLLKHAKPTLSSFIQQVKRAGYEVIEPLRALDASDFGVPQRRRRAFILGHRSGERRPRYPEPSPLVDLSGRPYFPSVWDALADLPQLDGSQPEQFERDEYVGALGAPSHYASQLRRRRTNAREPVDAGLSQLISTGNSVLSGCLLTRHTRETVKRFIATPPGGVEPVSRYHRLEMHSVARTLRAGTDREHGKHTAPRPIHPTLPRCITTREAARLHSFPDWFVFHPTRWHGFRQIGNSVPPLLGRAVAAEIRRACAPIGADHVQ